MSLHDDIYGSLETLERVDQWFDQVHEPSESLLTPLRDNNHIQAHACICWDFEGCLLGIGQRR